MRINGGFQVSKIKQLGDRIFEKILAERGIEAFNGAQGRILYVLFQEDGVPIKTVSEKCLYIAADTIYCSEVERVIRRYQPDAIIVNCCEATTPLGRLIMNLSDVEKICQAAPKSIVVASHLNSVNHALLTRKDIIEFADERGLSALRIPKDGECTHV